MKRLLIALLVFLPFQVEASGLQASFTGSNLSLKRASTRCEYDGSMTPSGDLLDISGYARNLAPSATAPTSVNSALQNSSGRRYVGRALVSASTQNYTLAHAAWMNMFSTNFTITMVAAPSSSGAGTDDLFDHLNGNNGIYFYVDGSHLVGAKLYNGTNSTTVAGPSVTIRDGSPHVIQIVRSGNFVTIFVDGTPGATTTVRTADGNDTSATLYLWGSGGAYFDGYGLYFRLDAEALSNERLTYERDQLMGLGMRVGPADAGWFAPASAGAQIPSSGFARASQATVEFSDNSLASWAVGTNIPRVAGDGGGVLIEGQRTNIFPYSQVLDNATGGWTLTNCTIANDTSETLAPDGTQTAEKFTESNDGAGPAVSHAISKAPTIVAATVYNFSIFVKYKASGRAWAQLRNSTVGKNAWFNIQDCYVGTFDTTTAKVVPYANGWCRINATATSSGTSDTWIFRFQSADNTSTYIGDARDDGYIWGAQLEAGAFPSSYIATAVSSVIRYADNMLISPIRLGTDLTLGTEKMWYDFSSDPAGHTNLCKGSQDFSNAAYWAKSGITVGDSALAAPDGTTTADSFIEDGTNAVHQNFSDAIAVTSGTVYTASVFLKYNSAAASPRSWAKLTLSDQFGGQTYGFFNIQTGEVGTTKGTDTTLYIKNIGNGWFRCAITGTADGTGNAALGVNIATADGTTTYAGSNLQVSLYAWGAQTEAASAPTGYVATTTTTRTAVSSNDGLFAFDKSGTINWVNEHNKGGYYQTFNGTDSQYVMADTAYAFVPAGNFSAIVAVTPLALPTATNFMYMFGKYTTTGDKRSWSVYYNDAGTYTFAVSQTGAALTTSFVQKTNGVQLGRPTLIVATFNCPTPPCKIADGGPGNNYEAKLYVDDTTPVTDSAFYGPANSNDANMNIARSGGGSRVNGHLHYVSYLDGVVLTQAQVTALYTKWKQANALPTGLGTGYIGQKLTIEFSAKCQFASSTDMGADRNLVNIGSLYFTNTTAPGGATNTRNFINIYAESSDGKVYADFYSGASTTRRYMYSAAITTYNQWHKYKVYYDFSNLASSNIWVDGVAGTLDATMTAAAHAFNITDTYVRIGQPNNALTTTNTLLGTTDSFCNFKNVRISPAQF